MAVSAPGMAYNPSILVKLKRRHFSAEPPRFISGVIMRLLFFPPAHADRHGYNAAVPAFSFSPALAQRGLVLFRLVGNIVVRFRQQKGQQKLFRNTALVAAEKAFELTD